MNKTTTETTRQNGHDGEAGIDYSVPVLYQRGDVYNPETTTALSERMRDVIRLLGEDPEREGLVKTPERVAKAYQYLLHGYCMDYKAILESALFHESYSEIVLVKDIELYSLCEHHMLPFYGRAHVAYIPNGRIVGLSKVARIVDVYARRLQVQERLTDQIADAMEEALRPHGVAVVVEANHLCMMMRGVEKQNSKTITSAMRGAFATNVATREEFLRLAL